MYVTTARLQYSNKAYICMVTKISIFTQPLSNLLFAHWEKPFVHANTDHEIITVPCTSTFYTLPLKKKMS